MTDDEIMRRHCILADYFAEVLGETAEVVVHDVRKTGNTVVYIRNNTITGRSIGDSMTDFGLKQVQNKKYRNRDFIANYPGTTPGKKQLRSSTYFIKNEEDNILGMLCVNVDITAYMQMRDTVEKLIAFPAAGGGEPQEQEALTSDLKDTVRGNLEDVIASYGVDSSRLSANEKGEIVGELQNRGVFLIRGAVTLVANALEVSEQTVYRYIKKFANGNG